ncbi:hypothetical protein K501DRAFT_320722 [Backusella circina FSU 941]|nr:hypothetical protein K501DRAFT_320722 [Backusella circina FSU 941]
MAKNNTFDPEFYRYVVGIDFGTTFSGASYTFTKSDNATLEIRTITKWPKGQPGGYPKVPTVIAYKDGTDFKEYVWGERIAKITKGYTIIKLFKLHLDSESKDIPPLPKGLTIVKVISDYLRGMHENICKAIKDTIGNIFDPSTLRYALTVPAMWTPQAKTAMREAAILAGIVDANDHPDRLMLIGEPEAAALYAEKTSGGRDIEPGKTALICDAGGGTVDLTVFEKHLCGDTMVLREITRGCGESSGSSMLDLRMKKYLKDQISSQMPEVEDKPLNTIIEEFIKDIKPNFEGVRDEDDETRMKLPFGLGSLDINTEDFKINSLDGVLIKDTVIKDVVFTPVIQSILNLIRYQMDQMKEINRHLDYIILVGGFGQSGYLYEQILKVFDNDVTKVFSPENGEIAVSTGAVYYAMDTRSISHRIMRISYGVKISSPFIENMDLSEYQYTDKAGQKFCKNRFDIFVRKGEEVSLNDSIKRNYYTFNQKACDIEKDCIPNDFYVSRPRYVTDPGVNKVAHFSMKLPHVEAQDSNVGTEFTFEMYFGHTEIKIEVDIPNHERLTFVASYESDHNIEN